MNNTRLGSASPAPRLVHASSRQKQILSSSLTQSCLTDRSARPRAAPRNLMIPCIRLYFTESSPARTTNGYAGICGQLNHLYRQDLPAIVTGFTSLRRFSWPDVVFLKSTRLKLVRAPTHLSRLLLEASSANETAHLRESNASVEENLHRASLRERSLPSKFLSSRQQPM